MSALIPAEWIQGLSPGEFALSMLAAWGGCVLAFYLGWRFQRRLRLIADTPKSMIRSAAQGYVELAGTARLMPGEPILSPLTRMQCTWWSYRIERYVHSGKNSHWSTVRRDDSSSIFQVDDGSGKCVVDPGGAVVYPSVKHVWYGNTEMPEGGPGMGRLTGDYRYTEELILDGDPLYGYGWFHTQDPVSDGDIDAEVRAQLAEWKRDQAWLIQHFDTNHDGQVDMQEWDAARQEARRLVLAHERENMQRPPVNLLAKPPDGRDYVLSCQAPKNLESRMRWYSVACLAAFLAGGILGLDLLHGRFG
ncbi:MAG TPA: GIDE domain-containing protein [Gammaproteobacteria bacterium]|nr:GIDE domain-containing protein [Gammaproteobacteria bacterium]